MKIDCIIQARTGSTRLPGKVMLKIKGKPLIGWMLERVKLCKELNRIIVAIPYEDWNSGLGKYLKENKDGYEIFSPPEPVAPDDVVGRFVHLFSRYPCDGFVRLCADSPLIDPVVIDDLVRQFRDNKMDYLAIRPMNMGGQCVEAVHINAWNQALPLFKPQEREHPTKFFIDRYSTVVDTKEDFEKVKFVIENAEDPVKIGWRECLSLLRRS